MNAQQIIQALHQQGITSYKIHKDTGISQMNLSHWKKGRTPIKPYFDLLVDYYKQVMNKAGN